jgi:hypothetical protein
MTDADPKAEGCAILLGCSLLLTLASAFLCGLLWLGWFLTRGLFAPALPSGPPVAATVLLALVPPVVMAWLFVFPRPGSPCGLRTPRRAASRWARDEPPGKPRTPLPRASP